MDTSSLVNQLDTMIRALDLLISDAVGIKAKAIILKNKAKEQEKTQRFVEVLAKKYGDQIFDVEG